MQPDIQHRHHDPQSGVTYIVFAYRELEEYEVADAVRGALARSKKKN